MKVQRKGLLPSQVRKPWHAAIQVVFGVFIVGTLTPELSEFILRQDDVRSANGPEQMLMDFLQSTYEAGAALAHWDREALERQIPLPDGYRHRAADIQMNILELRTVMEEATPCQGHADG